MFMQHLEADARTAGRFQPEDLCGEKKVGITNLVNLYTVYSYLFT